jgi:ethanolamine utilization protein EutM
VSRSYSLIEVIGLSNAIVVADVVLKTGLVSLKGLNLRHGSGQVALTFAGDTASAKAAHEAGIEAARGLNKLFAHDFIAAPDPSIAGLIELPK